MATLSLILAIIAVAGRVQSTLYQHKLQPFYDTTGLNLDGPVGEIVRQEPLKEAVEGGTGYRILYRTQRADNSPTFSSGMIFVPNNGNPAGNPVVAWAHGTLGLGDSCTPSRVKNPTTMVPGLDEMMANGWVVTATDYAGFGTPGTQGYLVGGSEARDVLNSVRAAQDFPQANATSGYVVWGHSQGGHSALFTASFANEYASELELKGTVASAPAAELVSLLNQQYGGVADWVIGPILASTWPAFNSNLNADEIMSAEGKRTYKDVANECIKESALVGLFRNAIGQKFLATNPTTLPNWRQMAEEQTAPILNPNMPLMVVESKTDKVVLPNTTALYIQQACSAGSNVSSLWLDNVSHMQIQKVSAPEVTNWLEDRFAGKPQATTCSQPLPIAPATQ